MKTETLKEIRRHLRAIELAVAREEENENRERRDVAARDSQANESSKRS